jgi:hypothetical protein
MKKYRVSPDCALPIGDNNERFLCNPCNAQRRSLYSFMSAAMIQERLTLGW